jgi:serine protease
MKLYTQFSWLALAATMASQAVYADRVIISYNNNGNALKSGHQIKAQGNDWFAVELDDTAKNTMRGMNGFRSMEADPKRFPYSIYNDDAGDPNATQVTPYGVYQSQADQLTLQPGQKVCIIDSGLDSSNQDFVWGNITGDNDPGTGNWFDNGGPHGTHVAGTVAAADNGIGVRGMAPGVPLHIIKVFNEAGWGYSSDLAQAASLCSAAGANIISMSLGGGGSSNVEENAFDDFSAAGGLVIAAAGNDGNNVRSYPAGYPSVMMIGAVDANNTIADFSQFPSILTRIRGRMVADDLIGVEVSAGGVATLSTYPAQLGTLSILNADGAGYTSSAMENTGSASGNTYFMGTAEATDGGASGKICVIDRGVISFHDKVLNCENSGGIGAVIINNEAGLLYGTLGETNMTSIPAVGSDLADRASIVTAATASVNVGAGDYAFSDGTSMATPTVSGVAALVWSNNPGCTGTEVRDALKATADDQGTTGRDDYYGYGIVKAALANTHLANSGCGGTPPPPGNIDPVSSFTTSCTLLACSFDASASSDSDGTIVSYDWTYGDGNTGTGVNAANTYAASGGYSVTLTVTDDEGATDSSSQVVDVTDGNEPPPADITLAGTRAGNGRSATINWSGATGSNVDVYINDSFNNTTPNDGSATYTVNKKRTYTFSVCEEGSITSCSDDITL